MKPVSMTGYEHYRKAEELLALADRDVSENWVSRCGEHKADVIAAAQAHATLALAWVQMGGNAWETGENYRASEVTP